jgi:hypothetical protein
MTDVLPKIRASDPHAKDPSPIERQDTGKFSVKSDSTSQHTSDATRRTVMLILPTTGPLANGAKLAAKLRNPATTTSAQSNVESKTGKDASTEGRASQSIDPLSQVCPVLDGSKACVRLIEVLANLAANKYLAHGPEAPRAAYRNGRAVAHEPAGWKSGYEVSERHASVGKHRWRHQGRQEVSTRPLRVRCCTRPYKVPISKGPCVESQASPNWSLVVLRMHRLITHAAKDQRLTR